MAKSALFTVHKNEPCPQCGAELVIRSGKHGPFLGCSHYPECDYVRPLKSQADGHIVKILRDSFVHSVAANWRCGRGGSGCLSDAAAIRNVNIRNKLINQMKRQLPALSASVVNWCSAALVMARPSIRAIAILNASSLSISNQ